MLISMESLTTSIKLGKLVDPEASLFSSLNEDDTMTYLLEL